MSSKAPITKDQIIVQAAGNLVSNMDGEKVMMSIQTGKYYNLGQVGGRIWDLIASPVSVNEVIDTLLSEYEVGRTECEQQVVSFLDMLSEQQLIQIENPVNS